MGANLKKKKSIFHNIENYLILGLIVFLIWDVGLYWKSIKNIDLTLNYLSLSQQIEHAGFTNINGTIIKMPGLSDVTDRGDTFQSSSLNNWYIKSMVNLEKSLIFGLSTMILIGYLIGRKNYGKG